ncbi:MAG: hypothetical protein ACPLXO_04215 [Desulfurella sp.]
MDFFDNSENINLPKTTLGRIISFIMKHNNDLNNKTISLVKEKFPSFKSIGIYEVYVVYIEDNKEQKVFFFDFQGENLGKAKFSKKSFWAISAREAIDLNINLPRLRI